MVCRRRQRRARCGAAAAPRCEQGRVGAVRHACSNWIRWRDNQPVHIVHRRIYCRSPHGPCAAPTSASGPEYHLLSNCSLCASLSQPSHCARSRQSGLRQPMRSALLLEASAPRRFMRCSMAAHHRPRMPSSGLRSLVTSRAALLLAATISLLLAQVSGECRGDANLALPATRNSFPLW